MPTGLARFFLRTRGPWPRRPTYGDGAFDNADRSRLDQQRQQPTGFNIDRSTDGVMFTQLVTTFRRPRPSRQGLTRRHAVQLRRPRPSDGDSARIPVSPRATTLSATRRWQLSQRSAVGQHHRRLWNRAARQNHQRQYDHARRSRSITKGIGTHASSTIIYNLDGQYDTFLSDVGVDDEENGKGTGSVDFQVIGDGKVLFDSGVLTTAARRRTST